VTPERWPRLWLLAAVALAALVAAPLSLPPGPVLRPWFKPRPGAVAGWLFWGACALVLGWTREWTVLGFLGLGGALLLAPGDGLEQEWRQPRWASWATGALLLMGLGLHLWDLGGLPQGMNYEEYYTLDCAQPVMDGQAQSLMSVSTTFSGITLYQHVVGWIYRGAEVGSVVPLRLLSVAGWAVLAVYGTLLARSPFFVAGSPSHGGLFWVFVLCFALWALWFLLHLGTGGGGGGLGPCCLGPA
jgi:hypothetical protein